MKATILKPTAEPRLRVVIWFAMKEQVRTQGAPQAIGPYSQAVKSGGLLFASGQVALDPATGGIVAGGIVEQTERVMKNAIAKLTAFLPKLGYPDQWRDYSGLPIGRKS